MPLNIIIVGGGIGGLAAAGFLRRNHKVTVLERGQSGTAPNDYGMAVVANAWGLLQAAGVKYENLDTVVMTHIWRRNSQCEEIGTIHFDTRSRYGGAPSVMVRRNKLQAELLRFATSADFEGQPAQVVEGVKATKVDPAAGRVWTDDGHALEGDLVIGADGINSVVRPAVLGDGDSPTKPNTHNLVLFITRLTLHDVRAEPALAYLAEPSERAGLSTFSSSNGPASRKRILIYNVSPNEFHMAAYTSENEFAQKFDEANSSIINNVPASRVMDELAPEFSPGLVNLFRHSQIDAWRIRDLPPIDTWFRDKAVLIGDAAHAVTPHAGQGCNITIEDAEALGYLLRDAGPEDVAARLEQFVGLRKERAQFVARRSREMGNILSEEEKKLEPIGQEMFSKLIHVYQGAEAALKAAPTPTP